MLNSYNTVQSTLVGKTVEINPGRYEVANYTEDGSAHSGIYYEARETIRGLVICTEYSDYNVMVKNGQQQEIVILVPRGDIKR